MISPEGKEVVANGAGVARGGRAGGDIAARQGTQRESLDGGGPVRPGWLGVSVAYFDLRIVSHGLVLCAVTLPIDPVWEMLQSKKGLLREASHGVAQGKRGRGLVPISSVWCRVEARRDLAA